MSIQLPLPPNFFKCPPLTPEEKERFTAMGTRSANELVRKAKLRDGPYQWTLLSDDNGLKVYKGVSTEAQRSLHCGTYEVAGSLEDVINLYKTETTDQLKRHIRRLGRAWVDATNLYTVKESTHDRPHDSIQLQWFAVKTAFENLWNHRDGVIVQCSMECTVDGKRGWVRSWQSIDLACIPDMYSAAGLVRMLFFGTGHLFVESDRPGHVMLTCLGDMDPKIKGPEFVHDQGVKAWCRNLPDVERCLREDNLSRTPFLREDQLIPPDTRRDCFLCQKKFGPMRRRSGCYKCGQVFCSKCNRTWNVTVDGFATTRKVCNACSAAVPRYSSQRSMSSNEFSGYKGSFRDDRTTASGASDDLADFDLEYAGR
ncbi:hypothetical protein LEN26_016211 [Aphanomyces euteiches]|nr:hypothetical protein LEN26_016211 [Aphanomyces euteiches]